MLLILKTLAMIIFIFSKCCFSPCKGHLSFLTLACRSLKMCNSSYNYFAVISCVCAIGSRKLFVITYFSLLGKCSDFMRDGSMFPKICLWLWREHHRNLSSIYFFVAKSLMIRLGPKHWEITETSIWHADAVFEVELPFNQRLSKKMRQLIFPG